MTEERGIIEYEARDGQQIKLTLDTIRKYLVQGRSELVTQQELMYFMGACKSRGLNPFIKDAYLIKFSENEGAAIITSIDYFRKRARAQRDCKGWKKGIIVDRDGKIVYSNGLMIDGDKLLGGWFKAQPEGWDEPFELEINLKGYIKRKKDGSVTKFWTPENQPSQIMKVAESQGLRTLWPDEFQQLYTPEEMGQSDMFQQTEIITQKEDTPQDLTDKIKGQTQKDEQFPCTLCDFVAVSERGLKKHITQSHPEPKKEEQPPDPPFDPGPTVDEKAGNGYQEELRKTNLRKQEIWLKAKEKAKDVPVETLHDMLAAWGYNNLDEVRDEDWIEVANDIQREAAKAKGQE